MNFLDLLMMSINNLRRRKLRTFLTVLGVIIGTASIVVMMSLGMGLQKSMYEQAEQSGGLTSMTVSIKQGDDNAKKAKNKPQYITDEVIAQLGKIAHVKSATPVLQVSGILYQGKKQAEVRLTGMKQDALQAQNLPVGWGTLPGEKTSGGSNEDALQLLPGNMVIASFHGKNESYGDMWGMDSQGAESPEKMWKADNVFFSLEQEAQSSTSGGAGGSSAGEGADSGNSEDASHSNSAASAMASGNTAKKSYVEISGVLKGKTTDWTSYGNEVYCDLDDLLHFLKAQIKNGVIPGQPKTKAGAAYPFLAYSSVKIKVDDPKMVETVMSQVKEKGYEVTSNMEYINSSRKQSAMIQGVLGAIGAVSLLVAAIGIANTMMMSIYERTKEIGVIKVLGCGLRTIRQMFLTEAAFIGLLGGAAGIMLSYAMSLVINQVAKGASASMGISGNISYIPVWLSFVAVVFAMAIGMVAGYFPAVRAMKLSPLAAINN
ncbi:ABC transporter permease [Hespellia stercorisuis]|uniref:FtsX-like permease family protein n=1 Tax=Hespellia stercorisuis DSM 15480 TaxID=1121950 RepID=A0A1M6MXL6_9FIRM|nr:ABC transporter permease [Hespellia stercorisuis]SHJ88228.1 FtsX-like permease family protein [Hespellia stercorisuis DSM 15480]